MHAQLWAIKSLPKPISSFDTSPQLIVCCRALWNGSLRPALKHEAVFSENAGYWLQLAWHEQAHGSKLPDITNVSSSSSGTLAESHRRLMQWVQNRNQSAHSSSFAAAQLRTLPALVVLVREALTMHLHSTPRLMLPPPPDQTLNAPPGHRLPV